MVNNRIAICIPVFNEGKNINGLLNSVNKQDFKEDLIIIIIASGCTDDTIIQIEKARKVNRQKIILLYESQRKGKSDAINKCIIELKKRHFDYAFFTDGDVLFKKDSLSSLFNKLITNKLDCVSSNPIPIISKNNIFLKIARENCEIWNEIRQISEKTDTLWFISGYLYLLKVNSLPREIPNTIINEDAFIGMSLLTCGKKIGYEPNANVLVKFPSNLSDYFLQKLRVRAGWFQIKEIDNIKFKRLRKLQREIGRKKMKEGNFVALICILMNELSFLGGLFLKNNSRIYIWKSPKSTK